jgi:hypothetical protein
LIPVENHVKSPNKQKKIGYMLKTTYKHVFKKKTTLPSLRGISAASEEALLPSGLSSWLRVLSGYGQRLM